MGVSILTSTKKILGIEADYTAFDLDIMTHINAVFLTLNQLRIGPADGFMIEGVDDTWDQFIGDNNLVLNMAKTYVYMRVRMLFDPPSTSYLISSMEDQIKEFEWRLEVATSPANSIVFVEDEVIELILGGVNP